MKWAVMGALLVAQLGKGPAKGTSSLSALYAACALRRPHTTHLLLTAARPVSYQSDPIVKTGELSEAQRFSNMTKAT